MYNFNDLMISNSSFKFPPLAKDFQSFNLKLEQDKENRTDLPYWLAEPLAQDDYLALSVPQVFHSKVLDELKASCQVNVSQHSPYFYLFAAQIIDSMYKSYSKLIPILISLLGTWSSHLAN
jgi:hypothetical protein